MSASYPPGSYLDVDLESEAFDHASAPYPPPRRRWRRVVATSFILLGCLALGVGLGVLAGLSGDRTPPPAAEPAAAPSRTPPAEPTPSGSTAAGTAAVSPVEAQRAVERRLARVALDRARESVELGFITGRRASELGPEGLDRALSPEAPVGAPLDEAWAPPDAEGGDEPVSATSDEAEPAGASQDASSGASRDEGRDRRRGHSRVPSPDRWVDPSVEPIDYDFSVPFEERDDRSREQLLELEQRDPYGE